MAEPPLPKHLDDPVFDGYQFREALLAKHIAGFFGEDIRDALKENRYGPPAPSTGAATAAGSGDGAGGGAQEGAGVVRPFALPQQQVRQLRPVDGGPGDGPGDVDRGNAVRAIRRRKGKQQTEQAVT